MGKQKTTAERGQFKKEIQAALYKSENIRELLLGDTTGKSTSEIRKLFKEHVKSHLFIDDTLTETGTFIFYDVRIPEIHTHIKKCYVYMYLICHRSVLEDYSKEGFYGDRIDILTQMVEDALINNSDVANRFGIGELRLDSIDIYNAARYYGSILTFDVPTFRYAT